MRIYKPRTEEQRLKNNAWSRDNYRKNKARYRDNQKRWRELNPEKVAEIKRRGDLKRYGLTLEQYDQMVIDQDNKCGICRNPERNGRRLSVDHCHSTGLVRRLLCNSCNRIVASIEYHLDLIEPAKDYINEFKAA